MKLHYRVKFRAFGVTFGTVEDSKPIGELVKPILRKLAGRLPNGYDVADSVLEGLVTSPIKLVDERGVFIEVTP